MDSRLSEPVAFAGFDETIKCLQDILHNGGRLFLIHREPEGPPVVETMEGIKVPMHRSTESINSITSTPSTTSASTPPSEKTIIPQTAPLSKTTV
ncbi:hypothetical protein BGZ98_009509 [Dissophora globulifera]|nr:hypothetical protein BGZ98_009509 [Dissophora globulifera]